MYNHLYWEKYSYYRGHSAELKLIRKKVDMSFNYIYRHD